MNLRCSWSKTNRLCYITGLVSLHKFLFCLLRIIMYQVYKMYVQLPISTAENIKLWKCYISFLLPLYRFIVTLLFRWNENTGTSLHFLPEETILLYGKGFVKYGEMILRLEHILTGLAILLKSSLGASSASMSKAMK